jgi:hypothetical protein
MAIRNFKTPSHTSPNNSKRGCICEDNTYSSKCCDGSLQAQGIGIIQRVTEVETFFLLLEDYNRLLQENQSKILL